tara:strand:- start:381 stop:617 length:237 start_codon:yes stop_codon:yes gene_type:complete
MAIVTPRVGDPLTILEAVSDALRPRTVAGQQDVAPTPIVPYEVLGAQTNVIRKGHEEHSASDDKRRETSVGLESKNSG